MSAPENVKRRGRPPKYSAPIIKSSDSTANDDAERACVGGEPEAQQDHDGARRIKMKQVRQMVQLLNLYA